MAMARTSVQDRVLIMELTDAGATARRLGERVGWSRATVRRWHRRSYHAGRAARRRTSRLSVNDDMLLDGSDQAPHQEQ